MGKVPLDPLTIAITLRYDPDAQRSGYRISVFGVATVGGWRTPVEIHPGIDFADVATPLPDIGLRVVASAIRPFIDKAGVQAIQRSTEAARKRLKDRRRP